MLMSSQGGTLWMLTILRLCLTELSNKYARSNKKLETITKCNLNGINYAYFHYDILFNNQFGFCETYALNS